MAYIKPSVIVVQQFISSPTAVTASLRPWICGPNAILHRYEVASEKESTKLGSYNFEEDTVYDYPARYPGGVVDADYSKLFVESANLCYYEDLESSTSGAPDITADESIGNLIHSETLRFKTNGTNLRSGVFGDRDVQIGDTIWLSSRTQQEQGGCKETGFSTKILGFTSQVSDTQIGEVEKRTDYDQPSGTVEVTSDNTIIVWNTSHPDEPIAQPLLLNVGGDYEGLSDGKVAETYQVYITRVVNTPGCQECLVNVKSGTGTDNATGVSLVPDEEVAIGTRGVTIQIDSVDYEKLMVTMMWTIKATQTYTAPQMTAEGTYTGAANDKYIIRCIRGGVFGTSPVPLVEVLTENGNDYQNMVPINAADVPVNIGQYNVTITFNGAEIVTGETYDFPVTGSDEGPINGLLLQRILPEELRVPGQGLDIRLSTIRDIEVPKQSDVINGFYNFLQEDTELAISGGIQVYTSEFTSGAGYLPLKLIGGEMFFHYREWVSVLSDKIYSISDIDELLDTDIIPGALHQDNPLKYGVYKAMANANGTEVRYTAVANPTDATSWQDAIAKPTGRRDVYTLVPLTYDRKIQDFVHVAVTQDSNENACAWKHAIFGVKVDDIEEIVTKDTRILGQFIKESVDAATADQFLAYDEATFITSGVKAGDTIRFNFRTDSFGNSTWDTYTVDKVQTETTLLVMRGPQEETPVGLRFEVWHDFTKQEKAEFIAKTAASFADRRICLVWPDEVVDAGEVVPGYFLNAAIAGLMGGSAPHMPLTRTEIRGLSAVTKSNDYFTESQMDTIAEAGGWIVEDNGAGIIYTRHALTTAGTTDVQYQEEMVTRNADSLSIYFFTMLDAYIGKTNVVDETITVVNDRMSIALGNFVTKTTPGLGGQIVDWSDLVTERNSLLRDQIDVGVDVELPIPNNRIRLSLRVGTVS